MMYRSQVLMLPALALCLLGCVNDNIPPGYEIREDPMDAQGVWKSEGYGWLVSIGEDEFSGFDHVQGFCQPNPDLSGPIDAFPAPYLLKEDGSQIQFSMSDPAYRYTLNRVPSLPVACSRPPAADPEAVFNVFVDLMATHYAFFAERQVDWSHEVAAVRPDISAAMSERALFAVMSGLIEKIDDAHLSLRADVDGQVERVSPGRGAIGQALRALAAERGEAPQVMGKQWRTSVQQDIEQELLAGSGTVAANGWIRYGLLDNNIGYLSIMAETNYAETAEESDHTVIEQVMNDALGLFSDADAVILDLSLNHGGDDGISRRIARRFTEREVVAYSKRARDGADTQQQIVWLRPSEALNNFTGPVYLVTSNHTVSAGEILVMSLKGLAHVHHVGGTTRGALSDILPKVLPNGWVLTLSNEIYLDRNDVLWEGRGIEPDQALDVFSPGNPFSGHVQEIRRLVNSLREADHSSLRDRD